LDVRGTGNFSGNLYVTKNITSSGYLWNNNAGITKEIQILKDVDLVGLTKTYCNITYSGGIVTNTTC
jgi:hypothetical protein